MKFEHSEIGHQLLPYRKILCWIKKTDRFYVFKNIKYDNIIKPQDIQTPMFWYIVHCALPDVINQQLTVGEYMTDEGGNTFMVLEK